MSVIAREASVVPGSGGQAAAASHKATSAEYGLVYQRKQADKYRKRAGNHWKTRVELAMRLADEFAIPRLEARSGGVLAAKRQHGATGLAGGQACLPRAASMPAGAMAIDPGSVRVVDIGCSIGTFAIEFAKRGFRSVGIDLDADALAIARELAAEEGVEPEFVREDVSAWTGREGSVDIAVVFDVFEHLHDDEIGALLRSIRGALSEHGTLIYHTFPTEFDYIFFSTNKPLWEPLEAFAGLPPEEFEKKARAYAARLDAEYLESGGVPHREWIEMHMHCNPLTERRMEGMLRRAGLRSLSIETGQLYPFYPERQAAFKGQPIVDRNLWGAAVRG